jgi:hypothetical protein
MWHFGLIILIRMLPQRDGTHKRRCRQNAKNNEVLLCVSLEGRYP